jgi:PHD/YefM family antitoxin component YafN of YafNO toxin-antitoxin module
MKEPTQFITNEKGERTAVIISIEDYEEIIERLEDLADIRAYDEAKVSGETAVPFEEALQRMERERKSK